MYASPTVNVRKAVLSDLPELRKLSIDSFVNAYASFNTKEDMDFYLAANFSEERLHKELIDGRLLYLVAEKSGVVTSSVAEKSSAGFSAIGTDPLLLGYVKLDLHPGQKGNSKNPIEISRLYTRKDAIGRGIGSEILCEVERYARGNNYDAICLDVWQKNIRAINFYQREGFSIVGLTQFVLGKDVQDDFVMVKMLPKEEIVIETERLLMRRFIPALDAAYFLELLNSPGWLKYIGDRKVHTRRAAMAYITNRVMKHYNDYGYGSYVVIEKSSGKSIGNAGLFKRPHLDHPDIGYAFLPEYQGKGYAYEASLAAREHAKKLGIRKLYGVTVPYNKRSIHLLEKLGLRFEKNFRMEGDPEELCLYQMELT